MKRIYLKLSAVAIAAMLLIPAAVNAQEEKDKKEKDQKEKEKTEKKITNGQTIVITQKGDNKEKVTVVIDGDKVTVNGKPIEDLKEGDITVNRHSFKTINHGNNNWNFNYNDGNTFMNMDENTAMLGVVTEKTDEGLKITDITEGSGAEKAGLKEDDIIT